MIFLGRPIKLLLPYFLFPVRRFSSVSPVSDLAKVDSFYDGVVAQGWIEGAPHIFEKQPEDEYPDPLLHWHVDLQRNDYRNSTFGIGMDQIVQTIFGISNIQKVPDLTPPMAVPSLKYDSKISLISKLLIPCPSEHYCGSPFHLPGFSTDHYLKLFKEQLIFEQNDFVPIPNVCRLTRFNTKSSKSPPLHKKSSTKASTSSLTSSTSMEFLIDDTWKWGQTIRINLETCMQSLQNNESLVLMEFLDLDDLAHRILNISKWIASSKLDLAHFQTLEHMMTVAIVRSCNKHLFESLSFDFKKSLTHAFTQFSDYFSNPKFARCHTQRDFWWSCCSEVAFKISELNLQFKNVCPHPPTALANRLLSLLLDSCKILMPSGVWRPAFEIMVLNQEQLEKSRYSTNDKIGDFSDISAEEMRVSLIKMVKMLPTLKNYIVEHQFDFIYFPTSQLPMKVPPRPWCDRGSCGPLYSRSTRILRELKDFTTMNVNSEFRRSLQKKIQARPVFDALNDLGATPWKVNKKMLAILMDVSDMAKNSNLYNELKLASLGIPLHPSTIIIPSFSENFHGRQFKSILEKERNEFFKKVRSKTKFRNEMYSLWCFFVYRLVLATHFIDDILYFPHNLDFRGRAYPISPHLNHMGDDINRCLLKFARGKPLGITGFKWLKLHCINLTGQFKREPIETRLRKFEELLPFVLDSAKNPFNGLGWWMKSDDPWQTLAACTEIKDAIDSGDPHSFISHLPVHQDGSCNGLQHYAALGRDLAGAREVNLLPSKVPNDIYISVAERVEAMRIQHETNESHKWHSVAKELRKAMPQSVPRKVIKQTVMTTVYGVTSYGARNQIKRQLIDIRIPFDKITKFSAYLADCTFKGLDVAFENSMLLKGMFQKCAKHLSQKLCRPVRWITPLGFPVVQPYVTQGKTNDGEFGLLPSSRKQTMAFPPNFVHSLDSTHMMLTALFCRHRGLTFAAVHDCFWTHACDVDKMNRICREQFIALHQEPIIAQLDQFIKNQFSPTAETVTLTPDKSLLLGSEERTFQPTMEQPPLSSQASPIAKPNAKNHRLNGKGNIFDPEKGTFSRLPESFNFFEDFKLGQFDIHLVGDSVYFFS